MSDVVGVCPISHTVLDWIAICLERTQHTSGLVAEQRQEFRNVDRLGEMMLKTGLL